MVPGSTLMYGSSFTIAILRPRASRMAPSEAAAMPFPKEETTPPVTQTNSVMREPAARDLSTTGRQVNKTASTARRKKRTDLFARPDEARAAPGFDIRGNRGVDPAVARGD